MFPTKKTKKEGKKLAPMITMIWPKPFFYPNVFTDDRGFGPTFRKPEIKKAGKKYGIWVPTGPAKWVSRIIHIEC